jgi:membrane fusion protein, copper/silver efflux system
MIMKNIFTNKLIIYGLFITLGLILGWVFFHSSSKTEEVHLHKVADKKPVIWTCAMHPQIRKTEPGYCPICGMELIPLNQSTGVSTDPEAVQFTKEAAQLANVQTSVISFQKSASEVRLYGKVQADEQLIQSQVAYVPGRIEKLLVNFTGETVRKGQALAVIYSPELITAQQELLEAAKTKLAQPEIYEAAKEKLHQWKLTESQIVAVENSGEVKANMEVVSTANGVVTSRRVNNGDYVNQGTVLYEVSDLSRVWVQFDAYESDLQFLNKGNTIDFTIQALQGEHYSGIIAFIDPSIDPVTRIAKVRVELYNHGGKLKPEMFASGIVKANLTGFSDKPVIPRSAVLWTGKRSIVYVKIPGNAPVFKLREIGLGPQLGNRYLVTDGLNEGEEIVTEGAFSVDAAAQLEGKPSMMNPEGNNASSGGMPGMDMADSASPDVTHNTPDSPLHAMDKNMEPKNEAKKSNIEQQMIKVSGNCDLCKTRIETAAKSVTGVVSAEWSRETKLLDLQFDSTKTNPDIIQKTIADAGHDTEKFKATDEVYQKLPKCCLYRQ